jgi:hypothetical protein
MLPNATRLLHLSDFVHHQYGEQSMHSGPTTKDANVLNLFKHHHLNPRHKRNSDASAEFLVTPRRFSSQALFGRKMPIWRISWARGGKLE